MITLMFVASVIVSDPGPAAGGPSPVLVPHVVHQASRHDTFRRTPKATLIDANSNNTIASGINGGHETSSETKPVIASAGFDDAAHFPLPEFGAYGELCPDNAVIIYEGMTLNLFRDGHYEIRFVVEAPQIPITLRLQLELRDRNKNRIRVPITLPPVTLRPEANPDPHQPSRSWLITHEGRSRLLAGLVKDADTSPVNEGHLKGVRVSRTGTVRFGTIPQR